MFINFVGVGVVLLVNWYYWWLDFVGVLVLVFFIIFEWFKIVFKNVGLLMVFNFLSFLYLELVLIENKF